MGGVCEKACGRDGGLTSGCYLVHTDHDQGTLVMHWSESRVSGAIAVFHPRKPVPPHKFTTNSGRVELMRKANLGVHKKRYLEGLCNFVKSAKQMDAALMITTTMVRVALHQRGDVITQVRSGALTEVSLADGVAAVPEGCGDFDGIKQMPKNQFLEQVIQTGASTAI